MRFAFRDSTIAEAGGWTAVSDPQDGRPRLYRDSDWLQQRDLAPQRPDLARRLIEQADRSRRFNDWLIRHGRVWPQGPS